MTRSANGSKRRTEKYRYALQMVDVQTHGDEVTVRARLTGEFPGSPVELDYIFKLSNKQDCFIGDSIMTMTYPFPSQEMSLRQAGSRNRRHKGHGTGYGAPFYSERRSVATTARSPLPDGQAVALFRTDGYRYGCRRARCDQSHSAGVGWTRHPSEQCRRVGRSERRIQGALR